MVSTKGRYALTVMVDLAKLSDGGYVSLADIAEKENLSMKYLESIISILNKGGLLQSLRGKNGGYKLARDPADYNIAEILLLTEGTLAPVNCIMQDGVQCEKAATCSTLPPCHASKRYPAHSKAQNTRSELLLHHTCPADAGQVDRSGHTIFHSPWAAGTIPAADIRRRIRIPSGRTFRPLPLGDQPGPSA